MYLKLHRKGFPVAISAGSFLAIIVWLYNPNDAVLE